VSAYVESSELCATSNHSILYSRRNDSVECIPLEKRLPLRKDSVADALLKDEILIEVTLRNLYTRRIAVVPLPYLLCRTQPSWRSLVYAGTTGGKGWTCLHSGASIRLAEYVCRPSMRWDCANDRRVLRDTSEESYLASIEVWQTRGFSARHQKDTAGFYASRA
jgi:hypothetical protein